jgi:pimeloyl-ACP methyl ester carboxylesterase
MRRVVAALSAAALTAGLAGTSVAQAAPAQPSVPSAALTAAAYTPPPIVWTDCTDPDLVVAGAKCGFVVVPLNYAYPGGKKIKLYVSRIEHTSLLDYKGVALVNPGGPGGAGVRMSRLGGWLPGNVGTKYDWIGWDPRGVGDSRPALHCNNSYLGFNRPNYVPRTAALMRFWRHKTAGYSEDCATSTARRLLGHVKTRDSVKDMESIRKALGVSKISYYGFSYGTYLGQVYATLHPNRVGRFVFDGTVDPRGVWYKANLNQNVAFDNNINRYFHYLANHSAAFKLGTDAAAIRRGYYALLRQLDEHPAYNGRIGPDELNDVMTGAAYYVYGWVDTGLAYSKLKRGISAKPIHDMFAGGLGDDNNYAMYDATQCTDVQWPKLWSKWKADAWRQHSNHPFLTWNNTWYNAPCLTWPAKAGTPVRVTGANVDVPILMVNETYDAATPYAGSIEVRRRFPTASLIEGVNGTTHSGSLSGVACTDDAIAAYLDTGVVPPRLSGDRSDKKCPPVPKPLPNAPRESASARVALMDGHRDLWFGFRPFG